MTHFKGKKLSAIDRHQQAEIARQSEVDKKHDAQFAALAIIVFCFMIWNAVITFILVNK